MFNNDVATLQNIADTLKEDPLASQRVLAKNAGISIGLMNAILKRFVERGWIMLSNVNKRKLAYVITPDGFDEITARGRKFVTRTFALASTYNEAIYNRIAKEKLHGKSKVILYGNSYIKFLFEYACKENQISFEFCDLSSMPEIDPEAFCIAGEMTDSEIREELIAKGCTDVLEIVRETAENSDSEMYE